MMLATIAIGWFLNELFFLQTLSSLRFLHKLRYESKLGRQKIYEAADLL